MTSNSSSPNQPTTVCGALIDQYHYVIGTERGLLYVNNNYESQFRNNDFASDSRLTKKSFCCRSHASRTRQRNPSNRMSRRGSAYDSHLRQGASHSINTKSRLGRGWCWLDQNRQNQRLYPFHHRRIEAKRRQFRGHPLPLHCSKAEGKLLSFSLRSRNLKCFVFPSCRLCSTKSPTAVNVTRN